MACNFHQHFKEAVSRAKLTSEGNRLMPFISYKNGVSIILSILFIRFFVLLCSLKTYLDISHKCLKNGKQQHCFLESFKHPYWNMQDMHKL